MKIHTEKQSLLYEVEDLSDVIDDKGDSTTIYECNVCNQNFTSESLALGTLDHQIIDGVLICVSNVGSSDSKMIEEIQDATDGDIILTGNDMDVASQQVIISLSDLK